MGRKFEPRWGQGVSRDLFTVMGVGLWRNHTWLMPLCVLAGPLAVLARYSSWAAFSASGGFLAGVLIGWGRPHVSRERTILKTSLLAVAALGALAARSSLLDLGGADPLVRSVALTSILCAAGLATRMGRAPLLDGLAVTVAFCVGVMALLAWTIAGRDWRTGAAVVMCCAAGLTLLHERKLPWMLLACAAATAALVPTHLAAYGEEWREFPDSGDLVICWVVLAGALGSTSIFDESETAVASLCVAVQRHAWRCCLLTVALSLYISMQGWSLYGWMLFQFGSRVFPLGVWAAGTVLVLVGVLRQTSATTHSVFERAAPHVAAVLVALPVIASAVRQGSSGPAVHALGWALTLQWAVLVDAVFRRDHVPAALLRRRDTSLGLVGLIAVVGALLPVWPRVFHVYVPVALVVITRCAATGPVALLVAAVAATIAAWPRAVFDDAPFDWAAPAFWAFLTGAALVSRRCGSMTAVPLSHPLFEWGGRRFQPRKTPRV